MEGVFIDRSSVNARRGFGVNSNYDYTRNEYLFRSYNSSLGHLLLNIQGSTRSLGSFESRPPPYSSLPSHTLTLPQPLHQPPLLPLPISKSPPSTDQRITTVRSRNQYPKKPRSSANNPRKQPRSGIARSDLPKEAAVAVAPKKLVLKTDASTAAGEREEEKEVKEKEEEDIMGSAYWLSPPPSSLPLPSFSLIRPKVAAVSEGTADDLRR